MVVVVQVCRSQGGGGSERLQKYLTMSWQFVKTKYKRVAPIGFKNRVFIERNIEANPLKYSWVSNKPGGVLIIKWGQQRKSIHFSRKKGGC